MSRIAKIKTEGKEQRRIAELEENWKRALADYENLMRRTEEEREAVVKFANAELILRLLPSVDLLNKAARHSQDKGVELAVEQMRRVLGEEGLEMVEPQMGEDFDEGVAECAEAVEGGERGKVAELVEAGYRWKNKVVLRPAKVKVYK
jgi:molecular chaperone GrpE